ncbi:GGDEF domain-containing protein [Poriferisphaera sp. WC338]|uniref:GGDEF domain-containing protein n=1 Tax=Poriferisphaera sp. WC338 TaxID=3425129 RepID=UPI003D817872
MEISQLFSLCDKLDECIFIFDEDHQVIHQNAAASKIPLPEQRKLIDHIKTVPIHTAQSDELRLENHWIIQPFSLEHNSIFLCKTKQSPGDSASQLREEFLDRLHRGQNPFLAATLSLYHHLGWRWTAVAQLLDSHRINIPVISDKGKTSGPVMYSLEDTPCNLIHQAKQFIFFNDVANAFPNDKMLRDMGVQTYAGLIYKNRQNKAIGHVLAMHDSDDVDVNLCDHLLRTITHELSLYLELDSSQREIFKVRRLALTDHLTRLGNRSAFEHYAHHCLDAARDDQRIRAHLVMIDIDHFKQLNDQLGHDQGDIILQRFSDKLSTIGRIQDRAFRLGGDEFVVIFYDSNNLTEDMIREKIDVILHELQQKDALDLECSFGLASFKESHYNLEKLLKLADQRMYKNKQTRRTKQHS